MTDLAKALRKAQGKYRKDMERYERLQSMGFGDGLAEFHGGSHVGRPQGQRPEPDPSGNMSLAERGELVGWQEQMRSYLEGLEAHGPATVSYERVQKPREVLNPYDNRAMFSAWRGQIGADGGGLSWQDFSNQYRGNLLSGSTAVPGGAPTGQQNPAQAEAKAKYGPLGPVKPTEFQQFAGYQGPGGTVIGSNAYMSPGQHEELKQNYADAGMASPWEWFSGAAS